MQLNTLPPETLGEILGWIGGGVNILRLWLTGDRKLHHLIKNRGALRSATFLSPWGGPLYCRLPGMLYSLTHLRELCITSFNRVATPLQLWNTISTLYNLRSLRLEISEAELWLMDLPAKDHEISSAISESLEGSVIHPTLLSPDAKLRPIADTLPLLEILYLGTKVCVLNPAHIPHFPKSLTSLKLPQNSTFDHNTLPLLHHLPNLHLIWLFIPEHTDFSSLILPPQITSLRLNSHGRTLTIPRSFWKLSTFIASFQATIDLVSAAALPSVIEDLCLEEASGMAGAIHHVPPSVTKLNLTSLYTHTLDKMLIAWPSNLKRLSLNLQSDDLPQHSLQTLQSANFVFPFQKSLQQVYITHAGLSSALLLNSLKLVPTLRSLTICSFSEPSYTLESLQDLPKSLNYLNLHWFYRHKGELQSINIDTVLPQFPPNLTFLSLTERFFMTSWGTRHIPKSLQALEIALGLADDDSVLPSHMGNLPRSLTSLQLYFPQQIAPLGPKNNGSPMKGNFDQFAIRPYSATQWTPAMLSNLPRASLTRLTIAQHNGPPITHPTEVSSTIWNYEALSSLPPTIRDLYIAEGFMDDQAIAGLPPNLTTFRFEGAISKLSGECFKLLPRRLVSLKLGRIQRPLSDAHLAHLPPRLWELRLGRSTGHSITPEGIASIVPAVGQFDIVDMKLRADFRQASWVFQNSLFN